MLNEEYLKIIKKLIPEEYPSYLEALNLPSSKGIVVNTTKISQSEFAELYPYSLSPNPYNHEGYIVGNQSIGMSPYYHAGLYYPQEPSAQIVSELIGKYCGKRILDMCAAPGGKSIGIANYMSSDSCLVSNEIVYSRAKILASNIERAGIVNAMVISHSPKSLESIFPSYFDTIIVDSPCSGEGMFRKEQEALYSWNMSNVRMCAVRDREILLSADKCLMKGGYLIYSTCTHNTYENEQVIQDFIRECPYYELVPIDEAYYTHASHGVMEVEQAIRIYPHYGVGEGHFACILHKTSGSIADHNRSLGSLTPIKNISEVYPIISSVSSAISADMPLYRHQDSILAVTDSLPISSNLRYVKCGVKVAEYKGKIINPSHNLATITTKAHHALRANYSYGSDEVRKYISGDTFACNKFKGYGIFAVEGYSLGLIKVVDGVAKNHYPKGLRMKI